MEVVVVVGGGGGGGGGGKGAEKAPEDLYTRKQFRSSTKSCRENSTDTAGYDAVRSSKHQKRNIRNNRKVGPSLFCCCYILLPKWKNHRLG
jgi:hypothetical protein